MKTSTKSTHALGLCLAFV